MFLIHNLRYWVLYKIPLGSYAKSRRLIVDYCSYFPILFLDYPIEDNGYEIEFYQDTTPHDMQYYDPEYKNGGIQNPLFVCLSSLQCRQSLVSILGIQRLVVVHCLLENIPIFFDRIRNSRYSIQFILEQMLGFQ